MNFTVEANGITIVIAKCVVGVQEVNVQNNVLVGVNGEGSNENR